MSNVGKHVPIRMCVVCGQKRAKYELIRLALDDAGFVVEDPRYRKPGRGAYVCPGCRANLKWDKRLQRAFRGKAKGLLVENSPVTA